MPRISERRPKYATYDLFHGGCKCTHVYMAVTALTDVKPNETKQENTNVPDSGYQRAVPRTDQQSRSTFVNVDPRLHLRQRLLIHTGTPNVQILT